MRRVCVCLHLSVCFHARMCGVLYPSLQGDSDLGLVGDEADGGTQHLVLGTLDGVRLDADHLPADLLKRQDLRDAQVAMVTHTHIGLPWLHTLLCVYAVHPPLLCVGPVCV